MSLDKSLKTAANLSRHRNVLKRDERVEALKEQGRWEEGCDPLGLPKVAHRKVSAGAKDKKEKKPEAEGETAEKKAGEGTKAS